MAHRQNQYPYGAANRPPPQDMHQGPPPPPRQPTFPDGGRDARAYGQPPIAGYGSYGGHTSPGSAYAPSQMSGPRPRPPYPTYPYDDPPAVGGQQYQQHQNYQYQAPPPPQHSYNPQHYAQTSPSASYAPPPTQGPPVPPRPFNTRPPPPQPYNPAAYSPALNQQSTFSTPPQQGYSPVNGNQSPQPIQHGGYTYAPMSPQQPAVTTNPSYFNSSPQQQHHQQQHPSYPPRRYSTNQYSNAPASAAQRESGSSYSNSPEALPRYSPPAPGQTLSTSPSRPAQSDYQNIPPPAVTDNAQFQTSSTLPGSYDYIAAGRLSDDQPDWSRQNLDRSETSGRHPQSRPLPGPPSIEPDAAPVHTAGDDFDDYEFYGDELDQDQLYDEIAYAVGHGSSDHTPHISPNESRHPTDDVQSETWTTRARPNGMRLSRDSGRNRHHYGDYSDDSDAEAAAGLEAMAIAAEEEENAERRRQSQMSAATTDDRGDEVDGSQHQGNLGAPEDIESDEENYGMVDMSSLGGGFEISMSYGDDLPLPMEDSTRLPAQHPSTSSKGSMVRSVDGHPVRSSSNTSMTDYSTHHAAAQVDQSGTGGLADPGLYSRKMSFDDSSENISVDEQAAAGADMSAGPPDLPYASSVSMDRPLPPTPQQNETMSSDSSVYSATSPSMPYGNDPTSLHQPLRPASPYFPRSASVLSHPSTPRPPEPIRAKTDGRRLTKISTYNVDLPQDAFGIQTPAHVGLDIPSLPPGRRFHPSKLSQKDFDACTEPWALSGISSWLRGMAEGESELRTQSIREGLVALFTTKVPNMNITIAEDLAADTLAELFHAGVLVHEEEWLKFGHGTVSGVLYQLTGHGCYAPFLHAREISGRCYAPHCQTMVKKVSLGAQRSPQAIDWATFYNLSKEDRDNASKTEIELQNNLHEIVTGEDAYMDQLNVLSTLYRDGLKNANPAIIAPQKLPSFLHEVFGKLDAVKAANEEHLLPRLRYRQQEQGPWITGFSDIFRHWIRKAKIAYIEYASNFPNANFLMKREESRNSMFVTFVESVRSNKLSNRLEWSSFLRAPILRLQRYSLLLSTAQKHMPAESATELSNLQLALEEIRAVTRECDSKVAESSRKADLFELENKISLRPEMKGVDLNLQQYGRKILFRGDLQRTGGSRFTWLQTHTILLDNYFILAKTITAKDSNTSTRYDISKMPIPMDLLVLESRNDDPVERSYKGISSVAPTANETRHNRANSSVGPGNLSQTTTNTSLSTIDSTTSGKNMTVTTVLTDGVNTGGDSKILYPFRVRHLGRETYILYASSAEARATWCEKIIEAKTEHAASLYAQNAEPFKLRVMADSAFAYDTWSGGPRSIMIKGSPLARAVHEVEKMYDHKGRPGPVCRARVNCATEFLQPYGTQMVAVGTDYGVYITERGSPRGWSRAIAVLKVTQVAVLEEFNLFLLISDKALIAYHLDVVCPPSGVAANSDSVRKAPQKLSGTRDVTFFVTGKMKDRTLIFYKKGNMSSTFKILEPILQRAPEKKRTFMTRGNTMSFREYDEFYIPADCTGLDVFTSTLAVATAKGLEILNLDKKTPFSVPDLKAPHVQTIAGRLSGITPLAMFRLNELEFLCVYEECAVYVNKHGDISRSVVMEFVGKAKAAALEGGYLILFDQDFIEIRNAQAGSLKQVISGRDIRCLDNGRGRASGIGPSSGGEVNNAGRSIKFALQHPEQERTQVVLELVLDETRRL